MTITRIGPIEPVLHMASTLGPWGPLPINLNPAPVSAGWESANRTVYFPMYVPVTCTAKRMFWVNGTDVAGAATIRVAMYRDAGYKPGARITNSDGSATQSGASTVQFLTPTGDFVLSPGLYWFAVASTSATNTTMWTVNGTNTNFDNTFRFQEATGTPPATATPVESTGANLYWCGFSTTTLT